MGRISLGPRGRNVFSRRTLGDDTTLTPAPPIPDFAAIMTSVAQISAQQQRISKQLEEDAHNRRIALAIAAASALFAAVKLGIIAFPHLKARVSRSPA